MSAKTEKLNLDKATVLYLLEKCNESIHTTDDFPVKSDVTSTVMRLAKAAELTWMDLITYTYSFLDAKASKNVLDAFRKTKTAISSKHEVFKTEWKTRQQTALLAMARRSCPWVGKESELVSVLKVFIDNMEDIEALQNYSAAVNYLKNEKGFSDFNIHFRDLFISKAQNSLKAATENLERKKLPIYWEFIVNGQFCDTDAMGSKQHEVVKSNFLAYLQCFEITDIFGLVESTKTWTTRGAPLFYAYVKDRIKNDPDKFAPQVELICNEKSKMESR